jgi:hypothetical protein
MEYPRAYVAVTRPRAVGKDTLRTAAIVFKKLKSQQHIHQTSVSLHRPPARLACGIRTIAAYHLA